MTNTILEILENNHPRIKDNMKSAKEIAEMMKEFIEWVGKNGMFFDTRDINDPDNNKWLHYVDEDNSDEIIYLTTENLFNYWYGNIYKK